VSPSNETCCVDRHGVHVMLTAPRGSRTVVLVCRSEQAVCERMLRASRPLRSDACYTETGHSLQQNCFIHSLSTRVLDSGIMMSA
jgi:hypothetical protein